MSKSFKIVNGDLSIDNRSATLVRGRDKLLQDLSFWLRERIGTDPLTPNFGSTLDGGIINGQDVNPFIGQLLNPSIELAIINEVSQQVSKYQKLQLEKIKSESTRFSGKTTLDRDEIISTIDSVQASNVGTTVLIQVTITTLANNSLSLTLPIAG